QFEIARQRMILNDPASSPDQRLSSIERIIQVRGELLTQQAHDGDATGDSLRVGAPRRAIWLADQAADLFFELLPIDAAGLTALAGVPSSAQRQRAARVAREMNALSAQAELEIEKAIINLASTDGAARAPI